MDCKLIQNNLIGYVEQTLPIEVSANIKDHLGSCASCLRLYENVYSTYTSYSHIAKPAVNPFIYSRIEQKLHRKYQPEVAITPIWFRKVQPVAATVLLFIGVSFGIYLGKNLSKTALSVSKTERSEVLNAYASEYYITSTTDENLEVLLNTE
jgi:predicted anti-sigma-YlaC factor YlaD